MGFFKKAEKAKDVIDLVKDGVNIDPDKVGEKLKEARDSLTHLNVITCTECHCPCRALNIFNYK